MQWALQPAQTWQYMAFYVPMFATKLLRYILLWLCVVNCTPCIRCLDTYSFKCSATQICCNIQLAAHTEHVCSTSTLWYVLSCISMKSNFMKADVWRLTCTQTDYAFVLVFIILSTFWRPAWCCRSPWIVWWCVIRNAESISNSAPLDVFRCSICLQNEGQSPSFVSFPCRPSCLLSVSLKPGSFLSLTESMSNLSVLWWTAWKWQLFEHSLSLQYTHLV